MEARSDVVQRAGENLSRLLYTTWRALTTKVILPRPAGGSGPQHTGALTAKSYLLLQPKGPGFSSLGRQDAGRSPAYSCWSSI